MHILAACWTEGNLTSSDNFYCCFQNIYQPKWDFLKTINQGLTQDRLNEYLAGPECRCSYIHTYIYIYIIYNMFIVIPINTHSINNIKYDMYVFILIYNDTTSIM